MNQLSLIDVEDKSYDTAKKLIYVYVVRGDSIGSLKSGMLGSSSPNGMSASISGYLNGKKYNSDYILVDRDLDGKKVDKVYKLKQVYEEIKSEQ